MSKNNTDNDKEEPLEPAQEEEDCMLCLEPFQPCDRLIPMSCPLDGCPFNYCSQCVWNLLLTSSQPYQEASDGSKQLKIPLQCPQCRTKYPHRQIVQDVLLLRQAKRLEPLFFQHPDESSLKASDLSATHEFRHQVSLETLKDAWARVDKYLKDRYSYSDREGFEVATIEDTSHRIPVLPVEKWSRYLAETHTNTNSSNETTTSCSSFDSNSNQNKNTHKTNGGGQAQYDIVDPTLFQGMDEAMTLSEQEFLSKLLISGSVSNLMHAAQVLYGMLQLMLQGGLKARGTKQDKTNRSEEQSSSSAMTFSALSSTHQATSDKQHQHNNLRMLTTGTKLLYPDMDTALLRKRFPLPLHMPRWIVLPVYHPDKRGVPLQFKNHDFGLQITSVKGSAGQQGLRKGDIVTHINEEACASSTPEDFHVYMTTLYDRYKQHKQAGTLDMLGEDGTTVTMVVNAHPDTAQALQKRSYDMIHFLTTQQQQQLQQQQQQQTGLTAAAAGGGVRVKK